MLVPGKQNTRYNGHHAWKNEKIIVDTHEHIIIVIENKL